MGDFSLYMEGDVAHRNVLWKKRNFAIVLFANDLSGTIEILFVYVCIVLLQNLFLPGVTEDSYK